MGGYGPAPAPSPAPAAAAPPAASGPAAEAAQQLARLISQNVDKESWADPYGTGDVGTMSIYGGLLIIQQTMPNHEKIAELLADIRKHKPTFK